MLRRELLKLSPLALASTVGHVAFADDPQAVKISHAASIYSVRDFGATGDGKTVDTPAINNAITAVAAAGGGRLVFPAGTYLCFTIHLQSNVEIYLAHGSVVQAAESPLPGETTGYRGGVYDAAEPNDPWTPYQDFGHNHWRNALFTGEGLRDFGITGPGMIFGKGLAHGGKKPDDIRGGYPHRMSDQAGVGDKAIALKNCHNVLLRDFRILKGGHFALLATAVDNLTVDNLLVDTDQDGFDIDCCRNVRVTNCTVNSPWDDAICPKSSFALGYARSTDNVTIANCYVSGCYELGTVLDGTWKRFPVDAPVPFNGRIKCGTESNGGFRNIAITNCVCEGSRGLALETVDGAFCEDIAITNIALRDSFDLALFLRLGRRNRGPRESMRPGTLRRVLISNIVAHNTSASTASLFVGLPENMIEDVKLSDCFFGHRGLPKMTVTEHDKGQVPMPDWHTLQVPEHETGYPEPLQFGPTPSSAFFLRHLKNLEMSHVEVRPENPDPRPSFWLDDVHRADFFAVTAPTTTAPNFSLHNVTDLRIFWSRAAQDATLATASNQML
jgi:hypothetical protein